MSTRWQDKHPFALISPVALAISASLSGAAGGTAAGAGAGAGARRLRAGRWGGSRWGRIFAVVRRQVGDDTVEILLRALRSLGHHVVDHAGPLGLVHPLARRHAYAMAIATNSLELGLPLPWWQGLRVTHEGTSCAGN